MDIKEKNLEKLKRSSIPMTFVKKNKGKWNHQLWEDFCRNLAEKNYTPIDFDKVGLLLEVKKKAYLAGKD